MSQFPHFWVRALVILFLALQCSGCGGFLDDYNYSPMGSSQIGTNNY